MLTDFDKVKFGAIWQRVTGETACAGHETEPAPCACTEPELDEADRLRRLMDLAARCIALSRCVATKCHGRIASALCGIVDDERRYMRKLRAMYFILTGGSYFPEEPCPEVHTASEGLREIYAGAISAREQLLDAANDERTDFADTYIRCASQKQRHARSVARLIESLLC